VPRGSPDLAVRLRTPGGARLLAYVPVGTAVDLGVPTLARAPVYAALVFRAED